jgi:hypothetical protein
MHTPGALSPSVTRVVSVPFEYMPFIVGDPVIVRPLPKEQHSLFSITQNEVLSLVIEAANVPRVEPVFNPALVQIQVGNRPAVAADAILSSTRDTTMFSYTTPGPWELSSTSGQSRTLLVSFCFTEVSNCQNKASFNVTIRPTPSPVAVSTFPDVVDSDKSAEISTVIWYGDHTVDDATDVTSFLYVLGADNIPLRVLSIERLSLASCMFRECSRYRMSFLVPENPAGSDFGADAVMFITAGGFTANSTFRYKVCDHTCVHDVYMHILFICSIHTYKGIHAYIIHVQHTHISCCILSMRMYHVHTDINIRIQASAHDDNANAYAQEYSCVCVT